MLTQWLSDKLTVTKPYHVIMLGTAELRSLEAGPYRYVSHGRPPRGLGLLVCIIQSRFNDFTRAGGRSGDQILCSRPY